MFGEFPAMFVDDKAKTDLRDFLKIPQPKNPPERKRWKEQLQQLQERFDTRENPGRSPLQDLDYELVWKLQADHLVDL